jgi:hypothetical protein
MCITVRTTLNIDDEALAVAQTYARARDLKLGQAVSDLILRGGAEKLPVRKRGVGDHGAHAGGVRSHHLPTLVLWS